MSCKYFDVLRVRVAPDAPVTLPQDHPFMCLSVVEGAGFIETPAGGWDVAKGSHLVAPCGCGDLSLRGEMTLICSYVPES